MKPVKPQTQPASPPPAIVEITSATQLQQLVEATVPCEFKLDGRIIRLPVQRMTAHTFERIRALRRKALPKWNDKRKAYDEYDPQYLEEVAKHEKWCRSLIIYAHCPVIASEQTGLSDEAAIHAHVSKFFTEHILEIISLTIQSGGMERVEERVDFTSPHASES